MRHLGTKALMLVCLIGEPSTSQSPQGSPDFRIVVRADHGRQTGELFFRYSVLVRMGSGVCPGFGLGAGQVRILRGTEVFKSFKLGMVEMLASGPYRGQRYHAMHSGFSPMRENPVIPPGRYRLQAECYGVLSTPSEEFVMPGPAGRKS